VRATRKAPAAVNVRGVIRVVEELRALGITPVFLSSDGVFDGSRGMWREDDVPQPILEYGRQKLASSAIYVHLPPPWLIVRLTKLLDPAPNPRCMLTGWMTALGEDREIYCATDQYFTPAAAPDVASAVALLVRHAAQGIYHLGGPRRLSRRTARRRRRRVPASRRRTRPNRGMQPARHPGARAATLDSFAGFVALRPSVCVQLYRSGKRWRKRRRGPAFQAENRS
jgi:dTDP-4-dehydrorhamnose reductase